MEQVLSAVFDKDSASYDRQNSRHCEACWNAARSLLPEVQGRWVLDAGCGTGLITERLADDIGSWGQVVGIDISPKMLEKARLRLADRRNITLAQASLDEVQSRDRSFDVVVCVNVLRHVDDLSPVLREWRRVLKPDGEVVLLDWDASSIWWKVAHHILKYTDQSYKKARSSDEVSNALQNHGFVVLEVKKASISPWRQVWVIKAKKS